MRGLTLMELVGVYLLVIGLGAVVGAGFVVSTALGLLALGVVGVTVGLGLMYLAAAREAAAKASGQHTVGGSNTLRAAA